MNQEKKDEREEIQVIVSEDNPILKTEYTFIFTKGEDFVTVRKEARGCETKEWQASKEYAKEMIKELREENKKSA